MDSRQIARGLGWFGVGLGLVELLAPRATARAAGLQGHERLLQLFGLREIGSGIVLLAARDPQRWLWVRVAGDGLDGALLAVGLRPGNPDRGRTLAATLAVAPVVGLDLIYALEAGARRRLPGGPARLARPLTYVRYADDVEHVRADEAATIAKIIASTQRLHRRTRAKNGRAVRVSHGKIHGAAVGELEVLDDLPEELCQGLFAQAGQRFPVIARLSNVPGEIDRDSVATQRGLAFKVLAVEGEKLAEHAGQTTQDFVLDSGDRFAAADARQFLMNHLLLEHAPHIPDFIKAAVSTMSRALNKLLHSFGGDSAMLDFFGHSRVHPMAEAYFTQAPIRFGNNIAKLAVVPVAPAQTALSGRMIDTAGDPNALRTATVNYLRAHDAAFEVRVQLCTDLNDMPVEDASKEWREDASPYRTVAKLTFPRQDALSASRRAYVDEALSFCPTHSLAAHRPLGSIMRARMKAYPLMSRLRRQTNGLPLREPQSINEVPT